MKHFKISAFLIIIIFFIASCNNCDITYGYNNAGSVSMIFYDEIDRDLLAPNTEYGLSVVKMDMPGSSNKHINFEITNKRADRTLDFYYLSIIDDRYLNKCEDNEGVLYIYFENGDIDTVAQYNKNDIYIDEDGCDRVFQYVLYFKYNGKEPIEYENKFTGSAIIRK